MLYPKGSDDEVNNFIKLGVFVFWWSIAIAVVTYPFSAFVYYRILTNDLFKNSYIYKMIVFNGFTRFYCFISYILVIHLGIIPDLDSYFNFIIDTGLGPFYGLIYLSSVPMNYTSGMFLAVNRLLSVMRAGDLRRIDRSLFRCGLLFSIVVPMLFSAPHLFSNGHYAVEKSPQNHTYHIPQSDYMYLLIPWLVYVILVAFISNASNIAIIVQLMRLRRRKRVTNHKDTTRMVSKVERGLIATVTSSSILQLLTLGIGGIASKYDALTVGIYLPLLAAVHTGSSFWFMLLFVPSVRKCILPRSIQNLMETSINQSTVNVHSKPTTPSAVNRLK